MYDQAHLPDPYVTDPEVLFKWFADDVLREVEIRRASNTVASKRAHAAAVEFLGLNRPELKLKRYSTYRVAKAFARFMQTPGVPVDAVDEARAELVAMTASSSDYAGMVRYFVHQVWNLPVPSPPS